MHGGHLAIIFWHGYAAVISQIRHEEYA